MFRFAVRSRWGNNASRSEVDSVTMQLAKLVGLDKVLATQVGNAFIRGVSGGERRRVSLAEALATCPRSVIGCRKLISEYGGIDILF